ncbi:MAG: M23 family metallopeptidase [Hormoscilla sp.]
MKDYRYLVVAVITCLAIMMTGGVTAQIQPLLDPVPAAGIGSSPGDGVTTGSVRLPGSKLKLGVKNGGLGYPLPEYYPISSGFGERFHPIEKTRKFHYGIDIAAPHGTPVLAAGHGLIVYSGWDRGYGYSVLLQHEYPTWQTFYAHLSKIYVNSGDWVEQGDTIGDVGSTGYSTGPHLHYEILVPNGRNWKAVDPEKRLGTPGAPPPPPPRRRLYRRWNWGGWFPQGEQEDDRETQQVFRINEFQFPQRIPEPWDIISPEGSEVPEEGGDRETPSRMEINEIPFD